jgi:hypothetical protein
MRKLVVGMFDLCDGVDWEKVDGKTGGFLSGCGTANLQEWFAVVSAAKDAKHLQS